MYLTGCDRQETTNDTIFVDCNTYMLYITAFYPSGSEETLGFIDQSPWAVLDTYTGDKSDIDAPEWMQWDEPSAAFADKAMSFVKIFKSLAVGGLNNEVRTISC